MGFGPLFYLLFMGGLGKPYTLNPKTLNPKTLNPGMSWHFYFMMEFINPKSGRKICPESELVFGMVCVTEPLVRLSKWVRRVGFRV